MVLKMDDWVKIAKDFHTDWNFPICIGSLDGRHINIRWLSHSGSMNKVKSKKR